MAVMLLFRVSRRSTWEIVDSIPPPPVRRGDDSSTGHNDEGREVPMGTEHRRRHWTAGVASVGCGLVRLVVHYRTINTCSVSATR